MGKNKQRNRKPDEHLLGENRLQRKQIRKLQQEIKRLRNELGYQDKVDPIRMRKELPKCPSCGKGEPLLVDLGIRKYIICALCKADWPK